MNLRKICLVFLLASNNLLICAIPHEDRAPKDVQMQQPSAITPEYNWLNAPATKTTIYGFAALAIVAIAGVLIISHLTPSDGGDEYGPFDK